MNDLKIYTMPEGIKCSPYYEVIVTKNNISYISPVYISSPPSIDEGKNDAIHYHNANRTQNFTIFSFNGEIKIEVIKKTGKFKNVTIRPKRYDIKPFIYESENKISFTINEPSKKISVEFDDDITNSLLIFADPLEDKSLVPDIENKAALIVDDVNLLKNIPDDKSILLFTPGIYDIGHFHVPNNILQIYLSGGSYIQGAIDVSKRENFILNGRGILSGENFVFHAKEDTLERYDEADRHKYCVRMIKFRNLKQGIVEGITIINAPFYNFSASKASIKVSNIKLLGNWRFNNDGVDVPENSIFEDCYISADDDSFKLYESNSIVKRCVIWQMNNGAVFQLGWFNKTVENVHVSDIDVIHMECFWDNSNLGFINFRPRNESDKYDIISNIYFENINIEGPAIRLIYLDIPKMQKIRDIYVKNVYIDEWKDINIKNQLKGSGTIENIYFKDIFINGEKITNENIASIGNIDIDKNTAYNINFD